MQAKNGVRDSRFFGLKGADNRPISVTTEIMDTDWYDEEGIDSDGEFDEEEYNANSPRVSLNSVRPMAGVYASYYAIANPRQLDWPTERHDAVIV